MVPTRRFGVRGRVTLGFGLLALGLSALLSGLAWTLVTRTMVSQTEQTALVETALDRSEVENALSTGAAGLPAVLEGVPGTDSAAVLAQVDGRWYATSPSLGPASLPTALVSMVTGGQEATQRIRVDGTLHLAVGLPLADGRGSYFEIYSLSEMQRTARVLSLGLVAAASSPSSWVWGWAGSPAGWRCAPSPSSTGWPRTWRPGGSPHASTPTVTRTSRSSPGRSTRRSRTSSGTSSRTPGSRSTSATSCAPR